MIGQKLNTSFEQFFKIIFNFNCIKLKNNHAE